MSSLELSSCSITASDSTTPTRLTSSTPSPSSDRPLALELSVFSWFQGKGIRQVNPEETLREHFSALKVALVERVRKVSSQEEKSTLRQRRARVGLAICV